MSGAPGGGAPRWLIYALGGGMGHLMRGSALARAAHKRGIHCTVLVNSPFAAAWQARHRWPWLHLVPRPTNADIVHRLLAELLPEHDRLIVDTFPRGIGGELATVIPDCPIPTVLVSRMLRPQYVQRAATKAALARFDLVLGAGEDFWILGYNENSVPVGPMTLFDRDELYAPIRARQLGFQIAPDDRRQLVVVSAVGTRREQGMQRRLAQTLAARLGDDVHVRTADPARMHQPLLRVLRGVDVLVGAGGYHTSWECRIAGVRLLARAQPRLYDDQALRLLSSEQWRAIPELIARIRRPGVVSALPVFNGAHAAVGHIQSLTR